MQSTEDPFCFFRGIVSCEALIGVNGHGARALGIALHESRRVLTGPNILHNLSIFANNTPFLLDSAGRLTSPARYWRMEGWDELRDNDLCDKTNGRSESQGTAWQKMATLLRRSEHRHLSVLQAVQFSEQDSWF